jgi:hypothetical protein
VEFRSSRLSLVARVSRVIILSSRYSRKPYQD